MGQGVVAQGAEQAKTGQPVFVGSLLHHAVIDQGHEAVEDGDWRLEIRNWVSLQSPISNNCFGCFKGEVAGEDAEAGKEGLFGRAKQAVAPFDGAAEGALATLPPTTDYRVSIVNAPGAGSYPISSFTWLLVYRNPADPGKAKKLNDFLKWALTEGEASAGTLDYAPLPVALSCRPCDAV